MQQHGEHLEEELKKKTEKLRITEREMDRALDELKDMKKLALEANMKLSETMSPKKVAEIKMELSSVQDSLSIASQELKLKQKDIESLKLELEKAKGLELKLAERDASLQKLKMELSTVTTSEANARALLSESKIRIQELEVEIKKGKESDMKTFDSLVAQTKQLEQTKILLEESKLEVASLREEMKKLEGSSGQSGFASQSCPEDNLAMQKALESLRSELLLAKEHLAHAQEGEKIASLEGKTLLEEMELLKNELKLATELEGNDKKAMDDLALALKEVAAEATRAKENLGVTQAELEYSKEEAENLKLMLQSKAEKYEELLGEAMKEADQYKNTAERLRLEAEDSLLAWNGKETGFVDCIKGAEEERFAAQAESSRLIELLTEEEKKTMASKEENQKLRDILKQALNEANVAKEAAAIARDENSQLKDSLAAKEDALDFLTRENENLTINHAAAFENIKELKRLLSETVTKELKKEEKDKSTKAEDFNTQNSVNKEHIKDGNLMSRAFSLNHKELKPPNKHKDLDGHHEMDGALRGSIFDIDTLDLPDSTAHFSKKPLSVFTDGGETVHPGDFGGLDGTHFEDLDNDRSSRKKRALLRRFGDLMRRRNFQRKETIIE